MDKVLHHDDRTSEDVQTNLVGVREVQRVEVVVENVAHVVLPLGVNLDVPGAADPMYVA